MLDLIYTLLIALSTGCSLMLVERFSKGEKK